jgi:cyclopropane fatty-acyl-phospholipid synthase-like methyltransferase
VTDPRTSLVAAGYDAMIDTWEAWKDSIEDDPRAEWCGELLDRLAEGATLVELGCGGGTAETRALAARFRLTGVDLSEAQLARARERVPAADYVHADLTTVEFSADTIDAVASFYVLNHVPRELLAPLFVRVHSWLRGGGLLLASLGASDLPGWTGDFLGAPSYFSGYPPETNRRLLADAGFTLVRDEIVTIREPEGDAAFHWILGRA